MVSAPRRFGVALAAALMLPVGIGGAALAHPLGNFTINHYARLEFAPNDLRVRYVLDLAEIPAFQERQNIDTDGDDEISDAEKAAYLASQVPELLPNLHLTVNGVAVPLTPEPNSAELIFSPGQAGLETMRLVTWLDAPFALTQNDRVTFRDDNFAERLGWREIVVSGKDGVQITGGATAGDMSNELTAYPEDMLNNPRNDREMAVTLTPGASVPVVSAAPITQGALGAFDRTRDELGNLINTSEALSPSFLLVAFLGAMALGALHAFSPGHGKAVVGAYLVGTRGNWQHAVFLGGIVTVTHTTGVYALGFVTLFLSAYILPEQLFPWLGFLSGMLVALIGFNLLVQRWRAARAQRTSFDRALATLHPTEFVHDASRGKPAAAGYATSVVGAPSHGAAVVAVPVMTADPAAHAHGTGKSHSHVFATPEEEAAHAQEHLGEAELMSKPTWKNLLSLGISGGLLPCPSALVVMLSAIALGRVLYGLYLIVGFSFGLAATLVITGLAILYAGKLAGRYLAGQRTGMVMRYLPLVGAAFVTILGTVIALEALGQTGLVR